MKYLTQYKFKYNFIKLTTVYILYLCIYLLEIAYTRRSTIIILATYRVVEYYNILPTARAYKNLDLRDYNS